MKALAVVRAGNWLIAVRTLGVDFNFRCQNLCPIYLINNQSAVKESVPVIISRAARALSGDEIPQKAILMQWISVLVGFRAYLNGDFNRTLYFYPAFECCA